MLSGTFSMLTGPSREKIDSMPSWGFATVMRSSLSTRAAFTSPSIGGSSGGVASKLTIHLPSRSQNSSTEQFTRITLPLTRVPLFLAVLLISVFTIQDAEGVYALTQGGPGYATEVTGVRLFKEAFLYFNIGLASSIGVALIILSILVILVYIRVLGMGEVD